MTKYSILLALVCAMILILCGSASAVDQTVIPSCADSNLTVSNDAGARFDVYGNNSYNFFNSTSQSATQGQNALHITTSNTSTMGGVVFTTNQSGTFYFSDTGGRGWDDNGILMIAINGTIPDNLWIHITASGYQWTPVYYENHPDISNLTYVIGSVNETFTKGDFLYGPQIWKPCPATNYPVFAGQDMSNTTNTFSMIFIDLWAGLVGSSTSYYNTLIDNGMIKIDYEIYNLPEGALAAFNAYAYCESSKQGTGIRWGNRVTDCGYNVYGSNYPPVADFSVNATRGTTPLTVQFIDVSTGTKPISYLWDFGDGQTSTEQNPTHTYSAPGTYTAKLTVTNAAGSNEKTITITTSDGDIVAPTPTANLPSGSYNTDKTVILSATDDWDSNPQIYYTLDGTSPTTSSTHYTGPISINGEGTKILKFIAVDAAGNIADPITRTYTIDKTSPTAAADPLGGTYNVAKSITLNATDATPTTIYYTTDGSDPRSSSTRIVYTSPITINKTTILGFAAVDAAGNWSPLYNRTYTMVDIAAPVPSVDLPSGSYTRDQVVRLTAVDELDPSPKIYYTKDGTTPTINSKLYDWPFLIDDVGTTVLKFIAVDWAGHISDVFTRIYILDKPGASGTWNSTILDSNVEYNSIAIDASGNPHIVYYQLENSGADYPDLKYAYMDQNGWHIETLETTKSGSGYYVSLALDSLGNPHIAYGQSTPDNLKYAYKDAQGWHFFVLVNNTDVSNINLALYQDLPRICYYENTEDRIKYMYYNGTTWISEYVTPNSTYGHYISSVLNSNGNPRISFSLYDSYTDSCILMYAKRSPTGLWQISTVDDSANVGKWSSLALDSLGNPRISYSTNDNGLRYAYWNETKWIIETVDNLKSEAIKLILDQSGNPRIAYQDFITGNFKYAYKDGSEWFRSNIDTIDGVGQRISMAMSQLGIPSVSYISSNSRLKYANLVPFVLSANPSGGSYELVQKINLTATSGTTIYYTVDGLDPRMSDTKIKYNGSISVNNTTTIKFAAVDSASNWSNVYTEIYSITDVTGPTISANPVGGTFNASTSVTLITTDVNPTKTYYTTDGSDPKTSSTRKEYTGPIAISSTTTLRFVAVDAVGNWGQVYSGTYTINIPAFSVSQIESAASTVRAYIETYHKLPDTVNVSGTEISTSQFLELLTTALLQINSGTSDLTQLKSISGPVNPKEDIHAGNIYKSEYMKLAGDIKNYMDSSGKSPDYAYGTSIGPFLRFESLVYMYTMILDYHHTSGNIAGWAAMEPWSVITSKPFVDPNAPKFSVSQIESAASTVRAYVETYHRLPSTIWIGSSDVSMPQFLELLTTSLLQITSGNSNQIILRNFTDPVNPREEIHAGNIYKDEYMNLASDIKNYMDSSGKSPGYAYGTSIGPYLRFESLVYMYAMILDYHRTSGNIAGWAAMEPWNDITSRPVVDPNAPKFTVDQIKAAAATVVNSVENENKLPDKVTINGTDITMSQFLELMTTALIQINSGNSNQIILRNFTAPLNPVEDIHAGNIYKSEYMKFASDIKNYMDSTGKTPDYVYGTSIGPKLRFESIVYMYSAILDYYNSTGIIAEKVEMVPWSYITSRPVVDPNAPKFTVDQIKTAASMVRYQIETNHKLPDKVTINGTDVKMPQFLELLTTALIQICMGDNSAIVLMNFTDPVNPKEEIYSGNIYQEDYLKMALDIKYYMDTTGKTPGYAYGTSIGPYLRFENLVYMYTMILDYYNTSGRLADWAAMKPWATI